MTPVHRFDGLRILTRAMMACVALNVGALAAERTENFDRDPGWEGHNNRSEKPEPRTIKQDFGFSPTKHAGGTAGEIGGFITPSAEAAYYARKIPEKTFADPLSASGTLACTDGKFHLLICFFNSSTVNEWRTPNTIALRIQGRGDKFYAYVEYTTGRWRAGGDTPGGFALVKDEERPDRMRLKGFSVGGAVHRWSLKYDPNGNGGTGSITTTIDDETSICHLDVGHKTDGAKFDHFGMLNVAKQADDGGAVWLDDVTVNGELESFAKDPGWDAFQNRRTYQTALIRPRFDFGYSETNYAGGKKGEMGGLVFRGDGRYPHMMAFYGDRLEEMSLERPLKASGKISLRRAVSDSDILIGFLHAEHSINSGGSDRIGLPPDFLGVTIGGPSREGFMLAPTYRLHNTEYGSTPMGPHILPDGAPHEWTLEYKPGDAGGRIVVTLDGKSVEMPMSREHRAIGAHFNRFGIISTHTDGNGQHLYFDDLTYTWTQAELPKHGVLRGPTGSVLGLAYSPDGRVLASGSRDKLVRLWDPATGKLLHQLEGHGADVYSVMFSPDGRTLLTGSGDRTMGLWDVQGAKLLRTIPAHEDIVRAAVFSPDGQLAASTGVDTTVRLWDTRNWTLKATLRSHTMRVKSLAFTPDGRWLASCGDDTKVCVWDVARAALATEFPAHDSSIETLVFSPDGKLLATSSNDTRVRLWETGTWKLLRTLEGHREEVDSVAFSPDGRTLASGSKDRTLKLWNPQTGELLRTIAAHDDRLESLAFSPAGQLASGGGGKDFSIKVWDALLPANAEGSPKQATGAAPPAPREARRRRMIFDNDGNDALHARSLSVENLLAERTSALAGSQVDTIFFCSTGGFGESRRPSKVWPMAEVTSSAAKPSPYIELEKQGIDMLRVMVDFGHAHGMEVFANVRMNDVHDGAPSLDNATRFASNPLKTQHPEYMLSTINRRSKGKTGSWSAANFALPEVRESMFRYLEEACREYDIDGLALDFFRHPCFFKSTFDGKPCTNAELAAMTGLMQRVRTMMREVGQKRGRPLLLSVRVPDSVGYCRALGIDIEEWLREGWVDLLVVTSYFQLSDWADSVALGKKYGVPVYPSLDEARGKDEAMMAGRTSLAAYRGRAAAAWGAGVSGILLFNWTEPASPHWRELGDPVALMGMDKDYFASVRGLGRSNGGTFPYEPYLTAETLRPDSPRAVEPGKAAAAKIRLGTMRAEGTVYTLRLRFAQPVDPTKLEVEMDGARLGTLQAAGEWIEAGISNANTDLANPALHSVKVALREGSEAVSWLDLMVTERHPAAANR